MINYNQYVFDVNTNLCPNFVCGFGGWSRVGVELHLTNLNILERLI